MGGENEQRVRDAYDVFDADLDALLGMLDPGIEWVSPADAIEPGVRYGHEGVRRAYAATATAWEHPTHTAEEFLESGEKVLVTVSFRAHGRGSGMDARRREYHVWTVRDGMPVRFEWFYNLPDALEALGPSGRAVHDARATTAD